MRLSAEQVERAVQFLRYPREAHELADHLFPERSGRDLTAKRRSGHASGRDLIERGVAVKQRDGTYFLSPQMMQPNGQPPQEPTSLEIEDGRVMRVRREVLGELPPLPEPEVPPAYAAPAQCAPLPQAAPVQQPQHAAPAQWTPPAQQAPQYAPPQPPQLTHQQIYQQYMAWCDSQEHEWAAQRALTAEVRTWRRADGTPLAEWEHEEKWYELQRRNRAIQLLNYQWTRALGFVPPDPRLDRELGLSDPDPPRAPMRRPPPSRPNGAARPW